MNEIEVLHLRQAAGGGGGADIALFDTLRLFNKNFFHCSVAYMVKQFNEVAPLARAFKEEGLELTQYTGSAWFDPFQLRSLHVFIRRRKVTILHCHDSKSRVFGCLLKLLNPHLQLIATLHGWIPHRMRSRIYIALDKLSLRFFKVNIAVSDEIQQKAVQAGAKKTLLIRNGVDTSLWRPAPKQFAIHQNRIVGFVGRLSKEKGIHEFIQIAAQISKQISNCIFWIVGEGPEKENIHKLVYDLGMERRIYQLGLKNRNELLGIYQDLDLLLLPSHYEGVPLTMLEAMSMEVPVVATRVGGMAEVLDGTDCGLLSEPGDLDAMSGHALALLRDQDTLRAVGKKARSLIQADYSLDDRMRMLEQIYMQLTGES